MVNWIHTLADIPRCRLGGLHINLVALPSSIIFQCKYSGGGSVRSVEDATRTLTTITTGWIMVRDRLFRYPRSWTYLNITKPLAGETRDDLQCIPSRNILRPECRYNRRYQVRLQDAAIELECPFPIRCLDGDIASHGTDLDI